jgi:hypothetical protein
MTTSSEHTAKVIAKIVNAAIIIAGTIYIIIGAYMQITHLGQGSPLPFLH